MVEQNIKAIGQLINKPLADFNESDIFKIIESDARGLLTDIPTIEYLLENTNDEVSSLLYPTYTQLLYENSMAIISNHLQAYTLNPEEYGPELKIQMESMLEHENAIDVLAATFVLLSEFSDFEFGERKEDIKKSLSIIETSVVNIPLPEGMALTNELLTNLYFPVVNLWFDIHKERLVENNPEFRSKLVEYTELIDVAEDMLLSESEGESDGTLV